jgi:predicted NBD/HSP70 family sugar kinase
MNAKRQVTNTRELRSFNRNQILSFMRTGEPMAKSDIAKRLDLSFATASSICNELLLEGLIAHAKKSSPSGGRPSELVELNPLAKVTFCIDFTYKTEVRISIGDLQNKLVTEYRQEISSDDPIEKILGDCYENYHLILHQASLKEEQVIGICVIVPGLLDQPRGKVMNSTLQMLNDTHLESVIRSAMKNTGLPVYIENDANLAALAVSTQGGIRTYHQALLVYVGEGLGLGIQAGEIFSGVHGFAGEIAHIPFGDPELLCYCGNYGCVENILSNQGILRELERNPTGAAASLGTLLGKTISVVGNLLDPEVIFIGGDQEDVLTDMIPYVRQEAAKRIILKDSRSIQIQFAPHIHNLFFEGASELIIQKWLRS